MGLMWGTSLSVQWSSIPSSSGCVCQCCITLGHQTWTLCYSLSKWPGAPVCFSVSNLGKNRCFCQYDIVFPRGLVIHSATPFNSVMEERETAAHDNSWHYPLVFLLFSSLLFSFIQPEQMMLKSTCTTSEVQASMCIIHFFVMWSLWQIQLKKGNCSKIILMA